MKCSCCKSRREQDLEKRGESNIEIQELVVLPLATSKLKLYLVACPSCDGDLQNHAKKDND